LSEVIKKYVGEVNYVVCEGTNVSRPTAASLPEHELQKQFKKAFAEHKSNIIYVSSTNVDRLFALYHAAIAVGRKFIVDNYQMSIMEEVVKRDTMWGKSKLYKFKEGNKPMVLQFEDGEFRANDNLSGFLTKQAMC
jgi:Predicted hydrolase of the metallo-beta-lactamase superfamily